MANEKGNKSNYIKLYTIHTLNLLPIIVILLLLTEHTSNATCSNGYIYYPACRPCFCCTPFCNQYCDNRCAYYNNRCGKFYNPAQNFVNCPCCNCERNSFKKCYVLDDNNERISVAVAVDVCHPKSPSEFCCRSDTECNQQPQPKVYCNNTCIETSCNCCNNGVINSCGTSSLPVYQYVPNPNANIVCCNGQRCTCNCSALSPIQLTVTPSKCCADCPQLTVQSVCPICNNSQSPTVPRVCSCSRISKECERCSSKCNIKNNAKPPPYSMQLVASSPKSANARPEIFASNSPRSDIQLSMDGVANDKYYKRSSKAPIKLRDISSSSTDYELISSGSGDNKSSYQSAMKLQDETSSEISESLCLKSNAVSAYPMHMDLTSTKKSHQYSIGENNNDDIKYNNNIARGNEAFTKTSQLKLGPKKNVALSSYDSKLPSGNITKILTKRSKEDTSHYPVNKESVHSNIHDNSQKDKDYRWAHRKKLGSSRCEDSNETQNYHFKSLIDRKINSPYDGSTRKCVNSKVSNKEYQEDDYVKKIKSEIKPHSSSKSNEWQNYDPESLILLDSKKDSSKHRDYYKPYDSKHSVDFDPSLLLHFKSKENMIRSMKTEAYDEELGKDSLSSSMPKVSHNFEHIGKMDFSDLFEENNKDNIHSLLVEILENLIYKNSDNNLPSLQNEIVEEPYYYDEPKRKSGSVDLVQGPRKSERITSSSKFSAGINIDEPDGDVIYIPVKIPKEALNYKDSLFQIPFDTSLIVTAGNFSRNRHENDEKYDINCVNEHNVDERMSPILSLDRYIKSNSAVFDIEYPDYDDSTSKDIFDINVELTDDKYNSNRQDDISLWLDAMKQSQSPNNGYQCDNQEYIDKINIDASYLPITLKYNPDSTYKEDTHFNDKEYYTADSVVPNKQDIIYVASRSSENKYNSGETNHRDDHLSIGPEGSIDSDNVHHSKYHRVCDIDYSDKEAIETLKMNLLSGMKYYRPQNIDVSQEIENSFRRKNSGKNYDDICYLSKKSLQNSDAESVFHRNSGNKLTNTRKVMSSPIQSKDNFSNAGDSNNDEDNILNSKYADIFVLPIKLARITRNSKQCKDNFDHTKIGNLERNDRSTQIPTNDHGLSYKKRHKTEERNLPINVRKLPMKSQRKQRTPSLIKSIS